MKENINMNINKMNINNNCVRIDFLKFQKID